MNVRSCLALVFSLLAFAAARPAAACECNRPGSPADEAARAEVVFVAKLDPSRSVAHGRSVRVSRVYKGTVPDVVALDRTDCVSPVDVVLDGTSSESALVYGYRMVDGTLAPTMCGGSKLLADAKDDVAYLEAAFPLASSAATSVATAPAPAAPSSTGAPAATLTTPGAPRSSAPPPPVDPGARPGCSCAVGTGPSSTWTALAGCVVAMWTSRRAARRTR